MVFLLLANDAELWAGFAWKFTCDKNYQTWFLIYFYVQSFFVQHRMLFICFWLMLLLLPLFNLWSWFRFFIFHIFSLVGISITNEICSINVIRKSWVSSPYSWILLLSSSSLFNLFYWFFKASEKFNFSLLTVNLWNMNCKLFAGFNMSVCSNLWLESRIKY